MSERMLHKTIRMDRTTADRIEAARLEGESASAATLRLIRAGLDASETVAGGPTGHDGGESGQRPIGEGHGPFGAAQEATGAPTGGAADADGLRAIIDVLRASNTDLRSTVATLTAQLEVKDRQIEAAHGIADHAQKLHALEAQKALPAEGQTRGGWITSLFRRR